MASVHIDKLSKRFQLARRGEVWALRDISLSVRSGEFLVLLGPSGSGKTTLLRLMAGLEAPTSGTISIDGQVVNALPPQERGVSMVFQEPALYPHMTVQENLAFGLKLRKTPAAEISQRVTQTTHLLQFGPLLDRAPTALSGGERQRVSLGRALVTTPKVLLLDEPLSNLDSPARLQLRADIAAVQKRIGATVLYVTHDQGEALALADRIAILNAGTIQQFGEPMEVYNRPKSLFVAGFVGSPPMNFFKGELAERAGQVWFGTAPPAIPSRAEELSLCVLGATTAERGHVILGLRPEHVQWGGHGSSPLRLADDSGAARESVVEAIVQRVERLGWETLFYLSVGRHPFVARLPADFSAAPGDRVPVFFDLRHAHWFDPATGQRRASPVE